MPTSSPTYLRPGVFVEESLTALANAYAPPGITIPVFMGSHFQGPTVPTRIASWTEFVARYGGFGDGSSLLAYAVFQYFNNGGRDCYILRVVGTGATSSTVTLNDRVTPTGAPTLVINANSPGVWGNGLYVDVRDSISGATSGTVYGGDRFDLILHLGGTDNYSIVERWVDLSMNPADPRYAPSLINNPDNGSRYVTVTDSSPASTATPYVTTDAPALQSGTPLAGATTPDPAVTAANLQAAFSAGGTLDQVSEPFILNMPGVTDAPTVNAAISYADPVLGGRGDVFVVVDCQQGLTVNQVTATTSPGVGGYTKSSYAALYYPWLMVSDPRITTLSYKTVPPGGSVVGLMVRTDTARGVQKAPAGTEFPLVGVGSSERRTFAGTDLDSLNQAGVNAIRLIPGTGYCVMGARTLRQGYSDRYISIRRVLIYLKKALADGTRYAIFEDNDYLLWEGLETNIGQFLKALWQQGLLRGNTPNEAFYVKCDADNNTPTTVSNGEVHIEVGVALQYPAEFIVIRVGQSDTNTSINES